MKIAILNDTHAGARNSSEIFLDYFGRFYSEVFFPYCEKHGIPYQVTEAKTAPRHGLSYADNFAFTRRGAWTH